MQKNSKKAATIFATTAVLIAAMHVSTQSVQAKSKDKTSTTQVSYIKDQDKKNWVQAKVVIDAPPNVVWDTVHDERKKDPDLAYSKVLSQKDNHAVLEQKFQLLPILGTSVCKMSNDEIPGKRIDYKLLHSDRFKAMEGSWVLNPIDNGKKTELVLSTHIDLGFPAPESMMNNATGKKLQRRLGNVKAMAERVQSQVAASENIQ
ncbi:MAG: SRPBCC family protein [Candidatus Melainabacteria bacterium]|nr:MAG: SRPBCC family protein [Candidatus Melainabacteria bacterium]